MFKIEADPKINSLYSFEYNGKKRVFLVTSFSRDYVTGYDFTREQFRQFKFSKIEKVKDITEYMVVERDWDDEIVEDWQNKGCLTYEGDNLYVVNIGR